MGRTTTQMELVSISKLMPYVNNARTHSPEQIMKLRSGLCTVLNAVTSIAGLFGTIEVSNLSYGVAAPEWNMVRGLAMQMPSMNPNCRILWFEPSTWHLAKRIA